MQVIRERFSFRLYSTLALFRRLVILLIVFSSAAFCIDDVKQSASINATELRLDNGLMVCLKPTDYESDEVLFKVAAPGGFASLDPKDRPSGQVAAQASWESGLGRFSSDQLSVFLYEHSLEFVPKIHAFSRTVEGEGGKQSVEAFLQCIKMLFTEQRFTEEGWDAAINITRTMISKQSSDYEHAYEAAFLQFNTQHSPLLQPLETAGLESADFETGRKIFQRSFSDPSEFTLVIVGSFNVQEVAGLVKKYLGSIPQPALGSGLKRSFSVPFPPGVTEKVIRLGRQPSSLTRMTFPLQVEIGEHNIHELAFISQIIEARLRKAIIEKMALSYGVDVSYEFPLYPLLNNPWISIRFRCDEKLIASVKEIILKELAQLQSQGVTPGEVETIKKLEIGSQEFWLRDNFYWLSMLTNYYLWGWDPRLIDYKNTSVRGLSPQQVDKLLKGFFTLANYSLFTAVPTN